MQSGFYENKSMLMGQGLVLFAVIELNRFSKISCLIKN
jgi:hypothetical protein